MFFCPELLLKRGHPFFLVWMAATQRDDRLKKYLTARKLTSLHITHVIDDVLKRVIMTSSLNTRIALQNGYFSLYLTAQLMYGCCVVLNRKAAVLIHDLSTISKNLRKMRFSAEKSQMVVQCPKKSRRKEINKRDQTKPLGTITFDIDEALDVDEALLELIADEADEALEYTHSVPVDSITLKEYPFPPTEEEHTLFGDEGDGGRGFIDFLNGGCQITEIHDDNIHADISLGHQPTIEDVPLHDTATDVLLEPDQPQSIVSDVGQLGDTGRISRAQVDDFAPLLPATELEQPGNAYQLFEDAVHEGPPEQVASLGNGSRISGNLPLEPPEQVDQLDIADGIQGDGIAGVVPPEVDPILIQEESIVPPVQLDPLQVADGIQGDGITRVVPPEVEPTLIQESVVPPVQLDPLEVADGIQGDGIARVVPPEVEPTLIQESVVPPVQLDPLEAADGIQGDGIARVVPPEVEPTLIQEESNIMELAEILPVPEVLRRRKRPRRLIIDQRIKLPSHEMQNRIDTEAIDTLRVETVFEDFSRMVAIAEWINLNAMSQPGRGNLIRSLQPLFSSRLVTHPETNDDLDETLNRTVRTESPPAIERRTRSRDNDTAHTLDSITLQAGSLSLDDRGQIDTMGPLVSSSPRRTFDDFLSDLSTARKRARFDSVSEPLGGSLPGLEGDASQVPPTVQAEKPESVKRSRLMSQSSDHQQQSSPKRRRLTETAVDECSGFEDAIVEPPLGHPQQSPPKQKLTETTVGPIESFPNLETDLMIEEDFNNPEPSSFTDSANRIQAEGVEGLATELSLTDIEKVPQDNASDSVASSSLCTSEDVLFNVAELVREKNNSTILIADLCPPSRDNRLKAASVFSALLDLHKNESVTLHQNREEDIRQFFDDLLDPVSISLSEFP